MADSEYIGMNPTTVAFRKDIWKLFYVQIKDTPIGSLVFFTLDFSFVAVASSNSAYDTREIYSVVLLSEEIFNDTESHFFVLDEDPVDLPDNSSLFEMSRIDFDYSELGPALTSTSVVATDPTVLKDCLPIF